LSGVEKLPTYEGRLELTWTNKQLRLLAHEDGSYEWVPLSDYRVAEVRLLHDAGPVGEVHGEPDRAKDTCSSVATLSMLSPARSSYRSSSASTSAR
jgi:hypothetical protein